MGFTQKRKRSYKKQKKSRNHLRLRRGGGMWKTFKSSKPKKQKKSKSKITKLDQAYHQILISPMARARNLSRQ